MAIRTKAKPSIKKKIFAIVLIAFAALILLVTAAVLVIWDRFNRPSFHSSDTSQMRTMDFTGIEMYPQSFATDALYLVRMVERTHPIFLLDGWLPDDYESIRDEFLLYAQTPDITTTEFAFAAARYITTLRDGHMTGANGIIKPIGEGDDDWIHAIYGGHFDIDWIAQDGRLFLLDEYGKATDTEVIEIGGVPIYQVFAVVERYYYAENEADRQFGHNLFSRFGDVIERAGGEITNDTLQLTLNTGGILNTKYAPAGTGYAFFPTIEFIIRYEMMDDIFVIDLRHFSDGPHITEVVQSIEAAIADGTRKFIVDLRGNGGGASIAGQRLLEAMGLTVPSYGSMRRVSPLLIDFMGWYLRPLLWFGVDYISSAPSVSRGNPDTDANNNPNNVFVSVLTDTASYSYATMMAVWVRDGGFGNIVGSTSRNAPNNFGEILNFYLPYSQFYMTISCTKWLRPDVTGDPVNLLPDIMVDPGDALYAALAYLRSLD